MILTQFYPSSSQILPYDHLNVIIPSLSRSSKQPFSKFGQEVACQYSVIISRIHQTSCLSGLHNINNPAMLDDTLKSLLHYILNCQSLSFLDPNRISNYKSLSKVSIMRSQHICTVERQFLHQLLPNLIQIVWFLNYLKCSHFDVKELLKVIIFIL